MKYYELIFEVTETCKNGNERRVKKSVFSPFFRVLPDGSVKEHIDLYRNEKARKALEEKHYYNIRLINAKITELLFTD